MGRGGCDRVHFVYGIVSAKIPAIQTGQTMEQFQLKASEKKTERKLSVCAAEWANYRKKKDEHNKLNR